MNQASVGFHCPECVASGKQRVVSGPQAFTAWQSRPRVTIGLIALNVAIFLVSIGGDRGVGGLRPGVLIDWSTFGFFIDEADEWWRLITGGFLHDGLFHLGFNMAALWLIGRSLESVFGWWRFGLLYFTSLLAGSFGALLVDPDVPVVGASGAVYGLLGALIIAYRVRGIGIFDTNLGIVLVLNLVLTFGIDSISVGGHIGGLLGGLAVGWLYYESPKLTHNRWMGDVGVVLLGAASFAGGLWAATTWASPIF